MEILLDDRLNFYKAEMHCHSTNSDGTVPVSEQKRLFKEQGYSVVAFTDHEHLVDNSHLDDEDFLTVTSCEIAIKENPAASTLTSTNMRVCHLNFYALDQHNTLTPCYNSVYDHFSKCEVRYEGEFDRVYSGEGISEIIRTAHEKGFLVSYNHPDWSLESAVDYLQYKNLDFVEVFNNACYLSGNESYNIQALDHFWRKGEAPWCVMADDSHSVNAMFGGWIKINAPQLKYDVIMDALRAGRFYASRGPEIFRLVRDGNKVRIKTSSAQMIAISTGSRRTSAIIKDGVTSGEFTLCANDGYFRITVTDKYGKQAITQPYSVR